MTRPGPNEQWCESCGGEGTIIVDDPLRGLITETCDECGGDGITWLSDEETKEGERVNKALAPRRAA